jgi:hypothetical protein
MLSCRNAIRPPNKIITNATAMRTRCFRAKATIAFMGLLSVADRRPGAACFLLKREPFENYPIAESFLEPA